jgi:hypothetical protein
MQIFLEYEIVKENKVGASLLEKQARRYNKYGNVSWVSSYKEFLVA